MDRDDGVRREEEAPVVRGVGYTDPRYIHFDIVHFSWGISIPRCMHAMASQLKLPGGLGFDAAHCRQDQNTVN